MNGLLKVMAHRAIGVIGMVCVFVLATPVAAAETPAEQISSFRARHGEGKVVRDSTLDGIAMDQARAMAAKDNLSHDALGPFSRRVAPSKAGRAAENIAYAMTISRRRSGNGSTPRSIARTCCCTVPPASASPAPRTRAASAPIGPW